MLKVSIITAVFNNESTIENTITSVLTQDYINIEHIIIDGESTDDTVKIVAKYKDKIRFTSEKDNGIYDAINKGIKIATGDIIGILNSDDFLADSNVISRVAAPFKNDKRIEAVFSDIVFVQSRDVTKQLRHYSSKFFQPWMFRFGFQPAHPTFYARKILFDKFGLYRTDLSISGDFELLLRFIKSNKIIYKYIDDIWVKMRVGGVSTSGFSSVIKLNNEIIKAHSFNNLYTNKVFVYSKYLIKWWGFLRK